MNRTAQNGPVGGVGTRENSKGLDLNRDYMKLDTAEARSLVGLMNKWDPHVLVDLHTTNGSYHANHLTYSPILNPNADARLIDFTRDKMLAPIRAGDAEDAQLAHLLLRQLLAGGWRRPRERAHRSRQSRQHHLAHLRSSPALRQQLRRPAQSHRDPVGGLQLSGFQGPRRRHRGLRRGDLQVGRRQREADHDADRAGRSRRSPRRPAAKPVELGVDFEIRALPDKVEILVGDVTKVPNPRSGREMLAMAPMAVPVTMKDYGIFAATRSLAMPKGWLIPKTLVDSPRLAAALDRLRWHGIKMQEFDRRPRRWRSSDSRSPRSPRRRGRSRDTRKRG